MQKFNATVISTTGAPGTGKSYSRCARFLWDVWLPEEKGVHWSNFPVNFEAFEKKYPDVRERVKVIPKDVLAAWAKGEGDGPWNFFKPEDLAGSHFALDECHLYLKRTGKGCQINAERWMLWLSDIRHYHCSVEFLSQDPHKVNKCIEVHSSVRILLVNSEDRRDPLFSIPLADWYELRASVSGTYETVIWQTEERRINGKWVQSNMERFTLDPAYFVLYNSYNNTQAASDDEENVDVKCLREFEKRGRAGLWFWFVRRNWFRLGTRLALCSVVLWLCFAGGFTFVLNHGNAYLRKMAGAKDQIGVKAGAVSQAVPVAPVKDGPPPATVVSKAPAVAVPASSPGVSGPVAVRSESNLSRGLEKPIPFEQQQQMVPRLALISKEFLACDDGRIVRFGERVGGLVLLRIDYGDRCATFGGADDGQELVVPVGGPIGVRLRQVKTDAAPAVGGPAAISGSLPTIGGAAVFESSGTGKR